MNKPNQVRELLSSTVRHLKQNPDALHIFVEEGAIVATGVSRNLSFEYQYNLIILVTDYAEHADTLMVPLLAWLTTNQPGLLDNPDRREKGFRFRAEQLNHKTCDIEITLQLTERVRVSKVGSGVEVDHLPEPPLTLDEQAIDWQLYEQGEHVEWPPHAG